MTEIGKKYKALLFEFKAFNDRLLDRLDDIEQTHKHEVREYNTLLRRLSNRLDELNKENAQLKVLLSKKQTTYKGLLND